MDGQPVGAKKMADATQQEVTAAEVAYVNPELDVLAAAGTINTMAQNHTGLTATEKALAQKVYNGVVASLGTFHTFFAGIAVAKGYAIQSGGGPKNP